MVNSYESTRIFEKLEKELYHAIDADKAYNLKNDAKFRAVQQNVETYEDFREIVNAAHLQPVTKSDKAAANKHKIWNPAASNSILSPDIKINASNSEDSAEIPQTPLKFWQIWQKSCSTDHDRFHLLKIVGEERLAKILASEMSWCAIGDVIKALGQFENLDDDLILVTSILTTLSEMQRFKLHLQLFGAHERQSCEKLFQLLKATFCTREKLKSAQIEITYDTIVELENKYEMN